MAVVPEPAVEGGGAFGGRPALNRVRVLDPIACDGYGLRAAPAREWIRVRRGSFTPGVQAADEIS
jgi:hypothetical protein